MKYYIAKIETVPASRITILESLPEKPAHRELNRLDVPTFQQNETRVVFETGEAAEINPFRIHYARPNGAGVNDSVFGGFDDVTLVVNGVETLFPRQ